MYQRSEWNCLSPWIKAGSALDASGLNLGDFLLNELSESTEVLCTPTVKQEASLTLSLSQTSYHSANPARAAALEPLLVQFLISPSCSACPGSVKTAESPAGQGPLQQALGHMVVHRRVSQEWPRQYAHNAEGITQLPFANFRAFRVLKIVPLVPVCPAGLVGASVVMWSWIIVFSPAWCSVYTRSYDGNIEPKWIHSELENAAQIYAQLQLFWFCYSYLLPWNNRM